MAAQSSVPRLSDVEIDSVYVSNNFSSIPFVM